jgi:hypothetical protein
MFLLSFFFILFSITACNSLPLPGVVTVAPPGLTRVAAPTPIQPGSPLPENTPAPEATLPAAGLSLPKPPTAPTVTPIPDDILPRYVIAASMDYDAKTLDVQQQIDYPNTSGEKLDEIVLAVQPNHLQDVFELKSLNADGAPVADYNLAGQKLTVKLTVPLEKGKTLRLEFSYRLMLPQIEQGDPNVIRPQIFGVTTRQVNLTDWYPMIVPYRPGSGWILHEPWYYGEHLVYPLANFDVTLRFTDPSNLPLIAASGEAEAIEGGWHFVLENGRDFALAMGRQLISTSAEVQGVTVTSYYYSGSANAGQAVLEATVKALQTYSALFGPYPHKTLAAVQGDFNDGMEFDGLYYLPNSFYNLYDGTHKSYLVMVAAHETCHQWWFGRVASDQSAQPWLDEALATYCEKLFYEKNYPEEVSWWWDYRVNFYQPVGKIDGTVASYGGFTPYTNATYRQGARFMEELRQAIGDEAFFSFLKDYASQMDGKIATSDDFFRLLREHTQIDISGLTTKYFQKTP